MVSHITKKVCSDLVINAKLPVLFAEIEIGQFSDIRRCISYLVTHSPGSERVRRSY